MTDKFDANNSDVLLCDTFTTNNTEEMRNPIVKTDSEGNKPLSTLALKILDIAVAQFVNDEHKTIDETDVYFSKILFGERLGHIALSARSVAGDPPTAEQMTENRKALTRQIKKCFSELLKVYSTDGTTKLIDSCEDVKSFGSRYVHIKFTQEFAHKLLTHRKNRNVSVNLLLTNNRAPNAYPLGRYLSIYSSYRRGINKNRIISATVNDCLSICPEIITIEKLMERGQRDWKSKIKQTFEHALDSNVDVGGIADWGYFSREFNREVSREESQHLSYNDFISLSVDCKLHKEETDVC